MLAVACAERWRRGGNENYLGILDPLGENLRAGLFEEK